MIPAILLVLCVVAYRVAAGLLIHSGAAIWLSNFAPLAAIALCCAAYLPRRFKFTLPLTTLIVSDVILNTSYGEPFFTWHILGRYIAIALVGLLGFALQNRASLKTMLPASLLGSSIFYVITNAFSWLTDPGYARSFAGLIQALTVGLPQYGATPTWMFFRNSLLSDLIFTAIFVLLMRAEATHARETAALARAT
ncbi:MAG: hypothetical protein DLM52_07355 [Chthoniobacterales bacterium]|nr:MAG: hypothetical protein DLM52_07355 [Chthoniobacterales bacterium]